MLPVGNNGSNAGLAKTELDCSAHDSGLDTPPSTHRPSSYREASRDSTETNGSSSRGTLLNNSSSPGGSFRAKKLSSQVSNLNQLNALHGSRYSVQDQRILKMRNNEEERCASIKMANRLNQNHEQQLPQQVASYDPNQNRYYKNGNATPPTSLTPQHTPQHKLMMMHHGNGNGNGGGGTLNGNSSGPGQDRMNGSAIFRERYQHPALAAIINEAQGLKFRGKLDALYGFACITHRSSGMVMGWLWI